MLFRSTAVESDGDACGHSLIFRFYRKPFKIQTLFLSFNRLITDFICDLFLGAFIGCIIEIVFAVFYDSGPPGLFGDLPPKKTPEVPAAQTVVSPAKLAPSQNNKVLESKSISA